MTTKVFTDTDDTDAPAPASALRAAAPKTAGWVDNKDAVWTVRDLTARIVDDRPPEKCARVHAVLVNGVAHNYRFLPDEQLNMPKEHALKFLRIPEFQVFADGELVPRPLDIQDMLKPIDPSVLPATQTVAEYSELTSDALLVRAKTLPGGEDFSTRSGKDALIAFMVQQREKALAMRRIETGMGTASSGSAEGDFMSDEDTRRLMRVA